MDVQHDTGEVALLIALEQHKTEVNSRLAQIIQDLPEVNKKFLLGITSTDIKLLLLETLSNDEKYPKSEFWGSRNRPVPVDTDFHQALEKAFLIALLRNQNKGYVLAGDSQSGAEIGIQIDYEKLAIAQKELDLREGRPISAFTSLFIDSLGTSDTSGNDQMLQEQMRQVSADMNIPLIKSPLGNNT